VFKDKNNLNKMDKNDLSKLMIRVRDYRDELAFSDIFDFIAPKLKAYYIQNNVSSEIAEELTQEVLSIVWSKSDKYEPSKSAVTTWIYTIARNKRIDLIRKNKNVGINEEDIREFLYENSQSDKIAQGEVRDQIDIINKKLDLDQRKIIKMNFFENKSHKKIAEELEIPLGTVKSRIRHILIKLQRIL
tara:strand:+ start:1688 stop:2251 length:564 start_codon:yes stop_codon:yes gene_type:complete